MQSSRSFILVNVYLDTSRSYPIQGQTHSKREWQKSNKINNPLNLIVKLSLSDRKCTERNHTSLRNERRKTNKRAFYTTVKNDNARKDELLKKVRELEVAQRETKVNTEKITAENDALNKEVDRLRHL